MGTEENSIEFDEQSNGWIVRYRCPSCGRPYKVTIDDPTKTRTVRCNFCKYLVKIHFRQNSISVS